MSPLQWVLVAGAVAVAAYVSQDYWAPQANSLLSNVPYLDSVRGKVNNLGGQSGY